MWTLVLVTLIASGAAIGGVSTTTSFLDFPDEAKCRSAADGIAGTAQLNLDRPGARPTSPPVTYRIIAKCVAR
jgi:hypothetical protein